MHSIYKQPLLHFLLLGGLLFVLYSWIGDNDDSNQIKEIVITPGRIETLAVTYEKVWQRPPSESELEGLIDNFVIEEIFYREAKAIGLDQDDTIVRRRMRQKMEFITTDLAEQLIPTEEELMDYLEENKESYRIDPVISFNQIYLNPDQHQESIEQDVQNLLTTLNSQIHPAKIEELGDRIMLSTTFENMKLSEIDRLFGTGFGAALTEESTGSWQGPIESGYGLHLVFVSQLVEGRYAKLDEIKESVTRDWTSANTRETNERFVEALKKRYTITIQKN
ncbi:MAG: peptidylprolyl isomerase [Verrucomicrobia bacterium]|nr:peptidylprolyl isomerase [Verrucomicrobiota bacterium]